MMYQERHSAIRKIISDSIFLLLLIVLFLSVSIMTLIGDTIDQTPEIVRIFLSTVFFLGALLFLYFIIQQITKVKNIHGNWLIELGSKFIKFKTPGNDEVEPFEYEYKNIKRLTREAYYDDGIWYKWFIYIENGSDELKKEFNLGPFLEEKIAAKIKNIFNVKVVEVDIKGVTREWNYSLWFKIKALFNSIFGMLIVTSFLVPGFLYLAKFINNYVD